jgi:hypothetical protein
MVKDQKAKNAFERRVREINAEDAEKKNTLWVFFCDLCESFAASAFSGF